MSMCVCVCGWGWLGVRSTTTTNVSLTIPSIPSLPSLSLCPSIASQSDCLLHSSQEACACATPVHPSSDSPPIRTPFHPSIPSHPSSVPPHPLTLPLSPYIPRPTRPSQFVCIAESTFGCIAASIHPSFQYHASHPSIRLTPHPHPFHPSPCSIHPSHLTLPSHTTSHHPSIIPVTHPIHPILSHSLL